MLDPRAMRAAQESMRPQTIKRFYKEVAVAEGPEGFALTLDGRRAHTPKKRPLATPTLALSRALAEEWSGQGEAIKPADMPLTRLANAAIDGVADTMAETRAAVAAYAQSDLACFRAEEPEALVQAQNAGFAPVLAFAEQELGVRFKVGIGIMPLRQPAEVLAQVDAAIAKIDAPLALAALQVIVSMTSSALLGLALWRRQFTADHVWRLAHIDEDHQIAAWGEDDEAKARRENHFRDMKAAAFVIGELAPAKNC